jgi:hypothetical protein
MGIRNHNFKFFHDKLGSKNKLPVPKFKAPLCYPFLSENGEHIREKLMDNRIYVAQYWPQVLTNTMSNDYDTFITKNLVCLPIDQRYDTSDLENVIKVFDQI